MVSWVADHVVTVGHATGSKAFKVLSLQAYVNSRPEILTPLFGFVFRDKVSLCSTACYGPSSVEQAGLEFRNPPASAS